MIFQKKFSFLFSIPQIISIIREIFKTTKLHLFQIKSKFRNDWWKLKVLPSCEKPPQTSLSDITFEQSHISSWNNNTYTEIPISWQYNVNGANLSYTYTCLCIVNLSNATYFIHSTPTRKHARTRFANQSHTQLDQNHLSRKPKHTKWTQMNTFDTRNATS